MISLLYYLEELEGDVVMVMVVVVVVVVVVHMHMLASQSNHLPSTVHLVVMVVVGLMVDLYPHITHQLIHQRIVAAVLEVTLDRKLRLKQEIWLQRLALQACAQVVV